MFFMDIQSRCFLEEETDSRPVAIYCFEYLSDFSLKPESVAQPNQISPLFANHDGTCIGVGRCHGRHDG